MSHQEIATLEYASACIKILDAAEADVRAVLKDCESSRRNSSLLIDRSIEAMMSDVETSAGDMLSNIEKIRGWIGNAAYRSDIEQTRIAVSDINLLKLRAGNLNTAIKTAFEQRMAEHSTTSELEDRIAGIEDEKVRTMAGLLIRNKAHGNLSFEDLVELAEVRIDPTKRVKRELVTDTLTEAREMMTAGKVSEEIIAKTIGTEETVSPLAIMDSASNEILDESLRRSAVQAIVKSISKRGFIVDKANIRHDRQTDTVSIVAAKPGGQKAEFSVDLTGKFMYHFQGYEGQACQRDIEPLEKDLEEVYGIKLTDRKTIWSNPDKTNKSHHMEMKVRRDSRCPLKTHSTEYSAKPESRNAS